MSSFLDELKQKLKSGSANAELKIITNSNKSPPHASSNGIQWGKIMGILGAVAVIVMLIVAIMLFLNNQNEKSTILISQAPIKQEKDQEQEDDPITDLDSEQVTTAPGRIREIKPPSNNDPNFTLLTDLL